MISHCILLGLFTGEGFDGRALLFSTDWYLRHSPVLSFSLICPYLSFLVIQTEEAQNSLQCNTTLLKQTRLDFCFGMGPRASLEERSPTPLPTIALVISARLPSALGCKLCWPKPPFKKCPDKESENSHGNAFQGYVTTPCV